MVFRFCDLPGEIREKIYRELLCAWKPQPTTVDASNIYKFASAEHAIDTAILRTNKAISREAYDVMIKVNRFIKVTSVRGTPLRSIVNSLQLPIVASNRRAVDVFPRYVMAVHLSFVNDLSWSEHDDNTGMFDPCSFMILHRDLDTFCEALSDGDVHVRGFSEALRLTITIAPFLADPVLANSAPQLQDFFSTTTQKSLLVSFRTRLRGFKHVQIQGHADSHLVKAVQAQMAQNRWSDCEGVLADLKAAKEKGSGLFQQGRRDEGCLLWQDAAVDVDTIYESSSWPSLVKDGGDHFASQLAELYFLTRLNIAHLQISKMQRPTERVIAGIMAEDSLNMAVRAMKRDHWMQGHKFQPSNQHLAKLRYRYALLLRLQDEPGTSDRALRYIDAALRLQPGDSAIMKERDAILAWKRQGL
ncbi:hypothetical protein BKA63DRAFT_37285 [Paraphoma chrysanthemicola]|nr:hypothetical protein BKA63DRAFT_37285 [Paraphoma chrysanthemicola]